MPENLFEKIDKQSETIDRVAEKLDDVSAEDLYALAKRTWDYKDFTMAQKYYNHISLLRPTEWKAPFYASLCGCLTGGDAYLFERRPKDIYSYYKATVEYIQNRKSSDSEKNDALKEATEIILSVLQLYVTCYSKPDNKKTFDESAPNFKRELQRTYMAVIKDIDAFENRDESLLQNAINNLAELLRQYCLEDKSIVITTDDFNRYIHSSFPEIKYEENVYDEPDWEKKKEIMTKGKCYLEYTDKVVARKESKKNLLFSIILFAITVITTVIALFYGKEQKWLVISAVVCFPISAAYLLRSIACKKGIRQDSWLYLPRRKYRERSDDTVICETKFYWLKIVFTILAAYFIIATMAVALIEWNSVWLTVIYSASYLIQAVLTEVYCCGTVNPNDCRHRFEYQGKTYYFNK